MSIRLNAAATPMSIRLKANGGTASLRLAQGRTGPTGPKGDKGEPGPALPQAQLDALDGKYVRSGQSDKLRTFKAALAGARTGGACDILVIGDSISEGTGPSLIENRWQSKFRDALRAKYGVQGGRGYVPAIYGITSPPSDKLWTPSGGVIDARILGHGLGRRNMRLNASGHKMTLEVPAGHTRVDIFISAIDSETSWYKPWVDGVAGSNVNVQAAASSTRRDLVFTLADGLDPGTPHTLAVEWGVGNVWLSGAMLYAGDETSGIRLWDGAHHGKTSSWFSDTTQPWWYTVNTIQPDLVVLAPGRNDWSTGVPVATYKANMETMIAEVRAQTTRDPSIVLMPVYGTTTTGSPVAPWSDYVAALQEIAEADAGEVSVLNVYDRLGTVTDAASNTLGITTTDYIHPSNLGAQMIADAALDFVTYPIPA